MPQLPHRARCRCKPSTSCSDKMCIRDRSKYDGANKAFTDWSLFRAAEVYLNYAEAKAELEMCIRDRIRIAW